MPYVKKGQWNAAQNLAARTIQKAWKNRRVTTPQAVRQIAKQVVLKEEETKSYYTNYTAFAGDNTVIGINPMYSLNQGTGSENVIGEKIRLMSIKLRGFLYNGLPAGFTQTTHCRLMLIHSRDKLHTLAGPSTITASNIYRAGGSGFLTFDSLDRHEISVIADKYFTLEPNFSGELTSKKLSLDWVIKGGKSLTFDADNSGYFKNGQYFVAMVFYDGRGASNQFATKVNISVNYKDA